MQSEKAPVFSLRLSENSFGRQNYTFFEQKY